MPEFAFFTLAPTTAAVQMPQSSSLPKGRSVDTDDNFSACLQQASEQQIQENHENDYNNDSRKKTEAIEDNTAQQVQTEATAQATAGPVPDEDSAQSETADQIDREQQLENSERRLVNNAADTTDIASSAQNDETCGSEPENTQQRKEAAEHNGAIHKEVVAEEAPQKLQQNTQSTGQNSLATKTERMETANTPLSTDKTERAQIKAEILPLQDSALNTTDSEKKPLPVAPQNSIVNRESSTLSVSVSQQQTLQGEGITSQSRKQTEIILARLQNIIDAGKETKTAAISIAQTQTATITMNDMATLRKDGQKPLTERQIIPEGKKTETTQTTSSTARLFTILDKEFSGDANLQQKIAHSEINTSGNTPEHKLSSTTMVKESNSVYSEINTSGSTMEHKLSSDNADKRHPQTAEIRSQIKTESPASSTASQVHALNNTLSEEENVVANLMQTENNKKEKQAEQQPERNNTTSRTAIVSPSTEGTLFSTDTGNSGSSFGGQAGQSGVIETPLTPAPTITLPSGLVVREDEIIRQFIDRFQINGRNLESRINIKLNPSELGEIKIALTVKEKSIKANVVAQSQITRQILEKNLGKLKNMLESQGFDIDAINITSSDEFLAEFNLSEQEFKRKQQNKQDKKSSVTVPDQEDTEQQTKQEDSINLMV